MPRISMFGMKNWQWTEVSISYGNYSLLNCEMLWRDVAQLRWWQSMYGTGLFFSLCFKKKNHLLYYNFRSNCTAWMCLDWLLQRPCARRWIWINMNGYHSYPNCFHLSSLPKLYVWLFESSFIVLFLAQSYSNAKSGILVIFKCKICFQIIIENCLLFLYKVQSRILYLMKFVWCFRILVKAHFIIMYVTLWGY